MTAIASIAGIHPGSYKKVYRHTGDTGIGPTGVASSAKFGDPPYRDRQGIGGGIRNRLSKFDIPHAATPDSPFRFGNRFGGPGGRLVKFRKTVTVLRTILEC